MKSEQLEALTQYVRDLYAPEDELLYSIRHESADLGMPQIHISLEEARLIQILLVAIGAQRALEIGTLAGYSALWILRALPEEGHLITLEYNEDHAAFARATFEKAGFSERAEVREGKALDLLPGLASEGPFDAVFIDANKENYPHFLVWAAENLRVGGLLVGHNAFLRGAILDSQQHTQHVTSMRAFNQQLADDPRWLGMVIPFGDGLAVAIRQE